MTLEPSNNSIPVCLRWRRKGRYCNLQEFVDTYKESDTKSAPCEQRLQCVRPVLALASCPEPNYLLHTSDSLPIVFLLVPHSTLIAQLARVVKEPWRQDSLWQLQLLLSWTKRWAFQDCWSFQADEIWERESVCRDLRVYEAVCICTGWESFGQDVKAVNTTRWIYGKEIKLSFKIDNVPQCTTLDLWRRKGVGNYYPLHWGLYSSNSISNSRYQT